MALHAGLPDSAARSRRARFQAVRSDPVRSSPPPSADAFRPDLEGLRGVAILLVLVFHARLPGTGGGFAGVDVFFVLSGFLITGLLLRERERTGRVDLRAFYARRARRILPAALVVLLGTLVLSWFILAPLDLPRVAGDVVASALSVGNIRFAAGATDYFGTDIAPSPVLHYWSLGVEEQFYLVWPALLIVATRSSRPRVVAGIVLGTLVLVSFLVAFWLTDAAQAWAFYSLPTRAWELALGGLLAVTVAWHERLADRLVVPLGWLGLGSIVAALVLIGPGTPYPGVAALLPAVGAAGVILAGRRRRSVGDLLVLPPLRFLGLISYSLYLVHWPILTLPAANLPIGEDLPLNVRLGLVVVAVLVGWGSYRWIELPIHRGRRFALQPSRTLAVAGAAIAVTVAISVAAGLTAAGSLAAAVQAAGGAAEGSGAGGGAGDGGTGGSPGASGGSMGMHGGRATEGPGSTSPGATYAVGPTPSPGGEVLAAPSPIAAPTPSGPQPLPRNVRPSLAQASTDAEPLEADGCLPGQRQVLPIDCVYGDHHGSRTVALVGDSHAAHWFAALQPIALARGWRLVPLIKLSCRFIDMPTYSYWLNRTYTECDQWRQLVVRKLQDLKPDLVVVAVIRDGETSMASDPNPVHQGMAMARLLGQVPGGKAIIVDTPNSRYNVPACLSGHVSDVRPCQTARSAALGPYPGIVERTAAKASGATLIDFTPRICPGDPCPVVLRGMIVYRDSHHLTATFAASLSGALDAALRDIEPRALAAPGHDRRRVLGDARGGQPSRAIGSRSIVRT